MQYLQKFKKTAIGNIPEEWELKELKEIADVKGGRRLPLGEKFSDTKTPYPYIRVSDCKDGSIDQTNLQFLTENTYKKIKNYCIGYKDVYISIAGTIGVTGLIPRELDGANLTENAAKIINLKNIKKEFMIYLFNSHLIQKQIQSHTGQVSQPKLALFRIEKIKLPLPPIEEQQIIATILSTVDELIQKTEQVIGQTQRLKKGLMQKLLTKGIEHHKFKKTELGSIPEEWKFEKLSENSVIKGRIGWQGLTTAEYLQKGVYYLVTGTDFKDGRIDWKNCVYVDEKRYTQDENIQLKKGDVLVTKDGTIGKIAFIDTLPRPTTLNGGIFVIRPMDKAYFPLFLYYVLYSNFFVKFLNKLKAGSTINHLYQKDFVNFTFPVPPYLEQQIIATLLSTVDELIQKQQTNKSTLENLKKGLMQQLLTGKIRVKV